MTQQHYHQEKISYTLIDELLDELIGASWLQNYISDPGTIKYE